MGPGGRHLLLPLGPPGPACREETNGVRNLRAHVPGLTGQDSVPVFSPAVAPLLATPPPEAPRSTRALAMVDSDTLVLLCVEPDRDQAYHRGPNGDL